MRMGHPHYIYHLETSWGDLKFYGFKRKGRLYILGYSDKTEITKGEDIL